MAAGFVLMFGVEQVLKKVGSIAIDEITGAWGLKKDLTKLSESTQRIQAVPQDAEDKQAADETCQALADETPRCALFS